MPPSFVSAFVTDVFRAAVPAAPQRAIGSSPGDTKTPVLERRTANRAILPRGPDGMVGVGATLPRADSDPGLLDLTEDDEPEDLGTSRAQTSPLIRRDRN